MGISGISFWQQDRNFWSQGKAQSQAASAEAAVISVMGQAQINLVKGMAAIANGTALNRVNSQLKDGVQSLLNGSSSTTSSSSGSQSSAASSGAPATAIGTVALTTSTPLSTLGILEGGGITVFGGSGSTKYTATGTDTVADLINALNVNLVGNAAVTASLNGRGNLVITGRTKSVAITISGTYASNIGFAVGNQLFQPKLPTAKPSTAAPAALQPLR